MGFNGFSGPGGLEIETGIKKYMDFLKFSAPGLDSDICASLGTHWGPSGAIGSHRVHEDVSSDAADMSVAAAADMSVAATTDMSVAATACHKNP